MRVHVRAGERFRWAQEPCIPVDVGSSGGPGPRGTRGHGRSGEHACGNGVGTLGPWPLDAARRTTHDVAPPPLVTGPPAPGEPPDQPAPGEPPGPRVPSGCPAATVGERPRTRTVRLARAGRRPVPPPARRGGVPPAQPPQTLPRGGSGPPDAPALAPRRGHGPPGAPAHVPLRAGTPPAGPSLTPPAAPGPVLPAVLLVGSRPGRATGCDVSSRCWSSSPSWAGLPTGSSRPPRGHVTRSVSRTGSRRRPPWSPSIPTPSPAPPTSSRSP